jgi:hypothetical protein
MVLARPHDKNRLEKQFISSQAFHRTLGGRVRETTVGERFEPQILESLGPVTQESNQVQPAIDTHSIAKKITWQNGGIRP